ncbi:MAG: hypothetical protein B7Y25_07755 [Alphaproteobacteria bacterium 16-39-46]|nr:MAG: hypothetical protein B7Y25_07755 [Alphaproteobacteria bacterium 16-39-46]OZA41538.1 MAG: hypothetical protein B7X84_07815 [Alphaproteobacteria bacterium 17-39-52]
MGSNFREFRESSLFGPALFRKYHFFEIPQTKKNLSYTSRILSKYFFASLPVAQKKRGFQLKNPLFFLSKLFKI